MRGVIKLLCSMVLLASCTANVEDAKTRDSGYAPRSNDFIQDCAECPVLSVVPPGSYERGGGEKSNEPAHIVTIDYPFAVGILEVTQRQWFDLMGTLPSHFSGDDLPVESVSWDQANEFVQVLSERTGQRYRLLSEAEWEYLAWAHDQPVNCDDLYRYWSQHLCIANLAWYGRAASSTRPAGTKHANRYGVFDLLGNVYEWTADCWNDSYEGAPRDGSAWTTGDCDIRVRRGGAWDTGTGARQLRPHIRHWAGVERKSYALGFRVARDID